MKFLNEFSNGVKKLINVLLIEVTNSKILQVLSRYICAKECFDLDRCTKREL